MNERNISINSINTTSHTSTPKKPVAVPPDVIPNYQKYSDKEADLKMQQISQDIYQGTKDRKSNNLKSFTKFFLGFVVGILAYLGIRRFF